MAVSSGVLEISTGVHRTETDGQTDERRRSFYCELITDANKKRVEIINKNKFKKLEKYCEPLSRRKTGCP
jgi:hypothetical protein